MVEAVLVGSAVLEEETPVVDGVASDIWCPVIVSRQLALDDELSSAVWAHNLKL